MTMLADSSSGVSHLIVWATRTGYLEVYDSKSSKWKALAVSGSWCCSFVYDFERQRDEWTEHSLTTIATHYHSVLADDLIAVDMKCCAMNSFNAHRSMWSSVKTSLPSFPGETAPCLTIMVRCKIQSFLVGCLEVRCRDKRHMVEGLAVWEWKLDECGQRSSPPDSTWVEVVTTSRDDIPGELPPKRGDDDHMIELIQGRSPPNKPPYRVSQAQQEDIMRQVNELVEKGMLRPSSSPFCPPGFRSFDIHILDVKWYATVTGGQRPSIKVAQNGFVVVDSIRLWTNQDDTFVFPNQRDQVFYYPMHGDTNWKYVIDVAPRATRVLQSTQELSTIDDVNRILDDNDDDTFEKGGSFSNAKLEYSSTSTDGSASESKNSFLNAFELDTNTDEIDTFSHSSIGLNLEIVLEIDHEDLYADIISVP
ncbi:hypothetical protein L7F22_057851 [Adiantum nelumboides]|nr:hypothetical protein [Adiantum nelumboides]